MAATMKVVCTARPTVATRATKVRSGQLVGACRMVPWALCTRTRRGQSRSRVTQIACQPD